MDHMYTSQKLEQVFDKSAVPLCYINKDASMLNFNKQFERAFGYSREEVKTLEDWFQLAYPDSDYRKWVIDVCYSELERATETNSDIKPTEYNVTCKNGDVRTALVFGSFIGDDMLLTFFDITEQKQAEEKLNFTRDRLLEAQQFAKLGWWEFDINENQITWSDELYEIFGITHDEDPLSFERVMKLIHPDYHDYHNEQIELLVKTGAADFEYPVKHPDGKTSWIWSKGKLKLDEDGNPAYMFGITQDITERKQVEISLKASEALFSTIFQNNPAAIAMTHLKDGRLVNVNNTWQELTGYSSAEAIGNTPLELNLWVNAEQRDRLVEMVRSQGSVRNEMQLRNKSGEILDLLMSAEPIEIMGQDYLLTMAQDITERNQVEKALRASHERFLTVLDSINATIYVSDMESYEILFVNKHMVELFGRDMTGEICWDVFRGESAPCDHCTNEKLLDENGKPIGVQSWQDRNPITGRWYINHDRAIEWTDGRMVKLQIAADISELKEMEEKLRQAQKMESIGNLAGGIAHDFNNILSSVIGFTELALDDVDRGTPLEDNLQEVYTASKRARDLVKQILAFARQSDEEKKPIRVDIIAKEVLKLIRSTIPTSIEIKESIECNSLIMGNPSQVHQIFMNLCTNAAQEMEDTGGMLEVRLTDIELNERSAQPLLKLKSGNYMKITVSDTGHGIPQDLLGSVFEPYFTTKGVGEGTGMGLALTHGIVESYGGQITVESELGKGTVFSIYLPITKKREDYRPYEKEILPSGTEKILFVDDEFPIAKMGSQILKRLGYRVIVRTSSVEALELFRSRPNEFDLVISDMTMSNLTGDKLAVELMKIRPDIPIVLCTGYSKKISDEIASEIGIRAFAYKPIVKADLAKIVRKVLDEAKGSSHD